MKDILFNKTDETQMLEKKTFFLSANMYRNILFSVLSFVNNKVDQNDREV